MIEKYFNNKLDIQKILNTKTEKLNPVSSQEIIKLMKKSKKNLTIHLYSTGEIIIPKRRKGESLTELYQRKINKETLSAYEKDIMSQIYITQKNNHIYYNTTNPGSSGKRRDHNYLIEMILKDNELRNKIKTSITIIKRKKAIKTKYFEKYSYMDFCIGMQGYSYLRGLLEKSNLPYSRLEYSKENPLLGKRKIFFNSKEKKEIIYTIPKIK